MSRPLRHSALRGTIALLAVSAATAGAACSGGPKASPAAIAESSSSVRAGASAGVSTASTPGAATPGAATPATTASTAPAGRYDGVHTGICAADAAAAAGDARGAKAAFADAHQGLHEVADEAAKTDRAASARLLEAKEKVEADLASPTAPAAITKADLDALLPALRAAAAATGHPMPTSCV